MANLDTLLTAIENRQFVNVSYETPIKDGTVTRSRKWLISHLYESRAGDICVVAYDGYRKEVRTFRVDRIREAELGEAAPLPNVPEGKALLYPASYRTCRAKPLLVTNPDNYINSGNWGVFPTATVLRHQA